MPTMHRLGGDKTLAFALVDPGNMADLKLDGPAQFLTLRDANYVTQE